MDEECDRCRFYLRPLHSIGICGCPASEFYQGPVLAEGYCPKFEQKPEREYEPQMNPIDDAEFGMDP